jgi:hypothetical protein
MRLQDWSVGQKVKVGFLRDLEVIGLFKQDGRTVFKLKSSKGVLYEFNPYSGLYKV